MYNDELSIFESQAQFEELNQQCKAIANLPPDEDETPGDEETMAVVVKASPYDAETEPLYKAYGISGKEINAKKGPLFSSKDDSELTQEDKEYIIECGLGLNTLNTIHAIKDINALESLGFEAPYQVGDTVKLKNKDIPHIFIVVSNDGDGYELAKPTNNSAEMRICGDGCWPRMHCSCDEIDKKTMYTLMAIGKILKENEACDRAMKEKLCPTMVPEYDTTRLGMHQLHEAQISTVDSRGQKLAKQNRNAIMHQDMKTLHQNQVMDEQGHLKPNNKELFKGISERMDEIFGTGYKDKYMYDGGPEVRWSDKPIES